MFTLGGQQIHWLMPVKRLFPSEVVFVHAFFCHLLIRKKRLDLPGYCFYSYLFFGHVLRKEETEAAGVSMCQSCAAWPVNMTSSTLCQNKVLVSKCTHMYSVLAAVVSGVFLLEAHHNPALGRPFRSHLGAFCHRGVLGVLVDVFRS